LAVKASLRARSAGRGAPLILACAAVLVWWHAGGTLAAPYTSAAAPTAAPVPAPTAAEVAAAIAKLRADPKLGTTKKTRRLRRAQNSTPPPQTPPPGWLHWLADAIAWVAGAARALLWVAAILAVGILGLYIARFVQLRRKTAQPAGLVTPTHVRELDIRPESLPENIGPTALGIWEHGEHRAALALLYRGLLSRLAHTHSVPIHDSTTEGECLQLATANLSPTRVTYIARLIQVWQRAVYGNISPTCEEVRFLCSGFAAAVDAPPETATVERAA